MKSNSEPLEVYTPNVMAYVKHNYRNHSDTDAALRKSLYRTMNNINNNAHQHETLSAKTGSETENETFVTEQVSAGGDRITTAATSNEFTASFTGSMHAAPKPKQFPKSLYEIYNSNLSPKLSGKLGLYDLLYNTYSSKTLVGNWFEDQAREEDLKQKCLEKECIYKNICLPKQFFERSTCLSKRPSFNTYVHFTDTVIFKTAKYTKSERLCDSYLQLDYQPKTFSENIEYLHEYPAISHVCYKENQSMVFRVKSTEQSLNDTKSPILYGQPVCIATVEDDYCLYSENTLSKRTNHSKLSPAFFTKLESAGCSSTNFKWMFVPLLGAATSIYEYEGKPVDTQKRCLIKHVNTGRYLLVCNQLHSFKNSGQFYEVACDSLASQKYIFKQNNQWSIVVNNLFS